MSGALRAFIVGISEYDHFPDLPGASLDACRTKETLQQLGFRVTRPLDGRVECQKLRYETEDFVTLVRNDVKQLDCPENPIVFVLISSHGVLPLREEYPIILGSDSPSVGAVGFDARDELVTQLNGVCPQNGILRVIIVFDCCLTCLEDTCFKCVPLCVSLQNEFYILYACDPGRRAKSSPSGGLLTKELIPLLHIKAPITTIFTVAIFEVVRVQLAMQRPWSKCRPTDPSLVPVLGTTVPTESFLSSIRKIPGWVDTESTCSTVTPISEVSLSEVSDAARGADADMEAFAAARFLPCRYHRSFYCVVSVLSIFAFSCLIFAQMRGGYSGEVDYCRLGPWVSNGPCSVSCGRGVRIYRRAVEREGYDCPSRESKERVSIEHCNPQTCPGCCQVCDLRCDRKTCEPIVNVGFTQDGGCLWGAHWETVDCGNIQTWNGTVLNRSVRWQWLCRRGTKEVVNLTDLKTGWSTEQADDRRDDVYRSCLAKFAMQLGFEVNSTEDKRCRLGPWVDDGPCSVTCGGGVLTRRRVAERNGSDCPSRESKERVTIEPCKMQSCPGCCQVCDLRCDRKTCEPIVNVGFTQDGGCLWGAHWETVDGGNLITWNGTVLNRSVRWQWLTRRGTKEVVNLTDLKTGWSTEQADDRRDDVYRSCLAMFAMQLGFEVNPIAVAVAT